MLALADVAVTVKDAKATAKWWQEKMGFLVHTVGRPGGHAIMVAPPGDRFVVHLCEGIERVEAGNTGIAFVTDDLEGQIRRMEEAEVGFTEPLRSNGPLGSAKFADPDGNVFWLLGAPAQFIRAQTSLEATGRARRSRAQPSRPRTPRRKRSK